MVVDRTSHPRLAALALLGVGWWLVGLVLGLAGPESLGALATITHLLGLATLLICGIAFGLLWWGGYLRSRFGL